MKHTFGPPRPVTGIALLFYVDDGRTSLETHVFTACYGDSFTFYIDDIHTSEKTHVWTSMACCVDILNVFTTLTIMITINYTIIRST
jgi:hypothetical protein